MHDLGNAAGECSTMKAKQLIEDAGAYGPEQINIMSQALRAPGRASRGGLSVVRPKATMSA
jgi:hypothetical protein